MKQPLTDQAIADLWRLVHEANAAAEAAWQDYDDALLRARHAEDAYWQMRGAAEHAAGGPDGDE